MPSRTSHWLTSNGSCRVRNAPYTTHCSSAMAARMRRAVGFRNVVGLYHPRCFVIVISARPQPDLLKNTVIRLRYLMGKPISVTGADERHHAFTPRFEFGAVTVKASSADPATVIDQAERMALAANRAPERAKVQPQPV